MAARKSWAEYSRAYRQRLERHGINESNYRTAPKAKARGHLNTPERPSQVYDKQRIPPRYVEYANKHHNLVRRVIRHKERMFGTVHKFSPKGSILNAQTALEVNPNRVRDAPTDRSAPTIAEMEAFLAMSVTDITSIDWFADEWTFLFYH